MLQKCKKYPGQLLIKTEIYLQSSRLNGGSVGQLCRGGFTLDTDQGFLNRVHPVFKGTEQDFL